MQKINLVTVVGHNTTLLPHMIKHYKGSYVNQSDVAVSKAIENFYASESYVNSIKTINALNIDLLKLKNKRRTAEMKIEIWRTLEASRRKGNV